MPDSLGMFVFITPEPYGAYHLVPLAPFFADNSIHLMPDDDHPVQGEELVKVTRDDSVIETCSAVIITGGTITPRTKQYAAAAARMGKPVFYVELAYAGGAPLGEDTNWLKQAFTGSEYSRQQIANHLGLAVEELQVIGYPHLDGLSSENIGNQIAERESNNVLLLGTVDALEINQLLQKVGKGFQKNGFKVTARTHPRDTSPGWEIFYPSEKTLLEDLMNNDVVVGIPGTAFLAASAANKIIWHPEHPEYNHLMPETHLTELSNALSVTNLEDTRRDVENAISTYIPVSEKIRNDIVGPTDGKAAERLWRAVSESLN